MLEDKGENTMLEEKQKVNELSEDFHMFQNLPGAKIEAGIISFKTSLILLVCIMVPWNSNT